MVIDDFMARIDVLQQDLLTERPVVETCAGLVAEALRSGHTVFCADLGHGLQGDFFNRAGGLGAVRLFNWTLTLNNQVPEALAGRPRETDTNLDIAQVELALDSGNARRGDFMLIGSVSGNTLRASALADGCRKRGITTIAFLSREYAKDVAAVHPSGKKLTELADYVFDLHVPYGDAAIPIPGYDHQLIPFSGLATLMLGWMLWGRVMELMGQDERKPITFMSANRAGGRDYYNAVHKELNEKGY